MTVLAPIIKRKAIKAITMLLIAASLLGITGCNYVFVDSEGNPIDPNKPHENPLLTGNSDSKLFEGTRYNAKDVPIIQHRTEEEIAKTGLTAQDVLNVYDQFAIDICKQMYATEIYSELSAEAYNNLSARFEGISPVIYSRRDRETNQYITYQVPFYAMTYLTATKYGHSISSNDPHFTVYTVTFSFVTYVDGVYFTQEMTGTGIQDFQFEKTMQTFGQEQYFLDDFSLYEKYPDHYYDYAKYKNQNAYDPFVFNRETIENATPEQLEALYDMIRSLRSINLEQKLLEE